MAGRFTESDEIEETHEINVTPFIDVVLVLLIIFMVAAPLATVDVPVELPFSSQATPPRPDKPIFVTLRIDGSVSLGDDTVTAESLPARLEQESGGDHQRRVYLRADKSVPYGTLMEIMDRLRQNGFQKIGLVALPSDQTP